MGTPLTHLADVTVVPVTTLHQHIPHGGPIWPDFARQTGLRHCREGLPVDRAPDLPAGPVETLADAAVWGGCIDGHFGHFVAEHVPRLPFALHDRPDDTYLFTLDPGLDGRVPDWVWQVFGWLGLARAQVRLVTAPLRVSSLRAGAQAEMLPQVAPSAAYLDLLDTRAQHVSPRHHDLVYISRAGIVRAGGGGVAGEGYVTGLLAQLGVALLDPGQADIATQLGVYAGARHLVFAEGSALHGRQLLGRVAQRITVLRRRPGRNMARAMLKPRVTRLDYCEVTATALVPQWKSGAPRPDPAMSFYDVARLFAVLAPLGIDISTHWDDAAYRAAVADDLQGWLVHRPPSATLTEDYARELAAVGFTLPTSVAAT